MKPSTAYSAFISYASENRDKADEICASLERRGLVCWMAPRDVRAGREYADEIIIGLERSAALVVVLSEAANTSVFVLREVERAVSKDINVVPVRIEEVTPSPGLELFISGTHWLDVWRGDWDDHMDRLVRDLSDSPAETPTVAAFARRRSAVKDRSFRSAYVAAGLAVAVASGGLALWSFSRETPQQVETSGSREANPVRQDTETGPGIHQGPTTTIVEEQPRLEARVTPSADMPLGVGAQTAPPADAAPGVSASTQSRGGVGPSRLQPRVSPEDRISRQPAGRSTAAVSPPAVDASQELGVLRDDYDTLSIRGGVIDDALNQLWEEMKPNSPRADMVIHQRSLRTNLTRMKEALADRDAVGARRYLASARADLEVLEQFLNR
jgi:hypothetical protein